MSRGFPSMTALLALLAIAGYQNRDKIAEMLRGAGQNRPGGDEQGGIGGWLSQLGLGGASAGGILSGGLGELLEPSNKAARGKPQNLGSIPAPTNHAQPPNLSERLVPRCWRRCRSKRAYPETSWSQDFAANFPVQLITTLHKVVSQRKPSFRAHSESVSGSHNAKVDLSTLIAISRRLSNGDYMDDRNRLYRRRTREADRSW